MAPPIRMRRQDNRHDDECQLDHKQGLDPPAQPLVNLFRGDCVGTAKGAEGKEEPSTILGCFERAADKRVEIATRSSRESRATVEERDLVQLTSRRSRMQRFNRRFWIRSYDFQQGSRRSQVRQPIAHDRKSAERVLGGSELHRTTFLRSTAVRSSPGHRVRASLSVIAGTFRRNDSAIGTHTL